MKKLLYAISFAALYFAATSASDTSTPPAAAPTSSASKTSNNADLPSPAASSSSSKSTIEVTPVPFTTATATPESSDSSNDSDLLAALKANGITLQDFLDFSRALREEIAKREEVEKFATQFANAADAADANKENTPTDLNSPPAVSEDNINTPTTTETVTPDDLDVSSEQLETEQPVAVEDVTNSVEQG